MSSLKDKLANSVRQARSSASTTDAQDRNAGRSRTARAPTVPPVSQPARPVGKESAADAQNPPPSAAEIFPRRVWPD